jgi:hypothetical protein
MASVCDSSLIVFFYVLLLCETVSSGALCAGLRRRSGEEMSGSNGTGPEAECYLSRC